MHTASGGPRQRRAWRQPRQAAPGMVEQAQAAIVILGQGGEAFDPVAVVGVHQAIAFDQRGAMDVAADDAVQATAARVFMGLSLWDSRGFQGVAPS